ncbi:CsbD family protein [Blastomonas sp. UPD001]|uniref:CsbD family protein n=1 Tax=Blastomonas sp. UPD001 TaxID=2217673 RepID=UPI000E347128|nr:CsbD family protein [Blastomonas sp. UPD001]
MNDDQLKGAWRQAEGWIKEQWGLLTDDDLAIIEGQTEQLIGRIQERYGVERSKAEHDVREWFQARFGSFR